MKFLCAKLFSLILLGCVIACGGAVIHGQEASVSLTSGGYPQVSGHLPTTPASSQSQPGTTLTANLNFGEVTPVGITSRRISVTMPIRISASRNYKLEIRRSSGGDSGGVKPSDIGFGIVNIRPENTGGKNLTPNATNVSIAGNFVVNPVQTPVVNGYPRFKATLADIFETQTTVLQGVPTVASGNLGDSGSAICADLVFVIVPQYFTPTDSHGITLLIKITPIETP